MFLYDQPRIRLPNLKFVRVAELLLEHTRERRMYWDTRKNTMHTTGDSGGMVKPGMWYHTRNRFVLRPSLERDGQKAPALELVLQGKQNRCWVTVDVLRGMPIIEDLAQAVGKQIAETGQMLDELIAELEAM